MASSPDEVRDYFERVREHCGDLRRLERRIERMRDRSFATGVPSARGMGTGDPTANAALRISDAEGELARLVAEHEGSIAACRDLCGGVRRGLGAVYGDILEDYYANGLSWRQVAAICGLHPNTVIRKRDTACEWIAEVGMERARMGMGRATDGDGW